MLKMKWRIKTKGGKKMPNGKEVEHKYIDQWCAERHKKLDERVDNLDRRLWWILGLLITQIFTTAGSIITFVTVI